MVVRCLFVLLLLPAALFADDGRPLFTTMPDGTIGVTFPVNVLRDDEVSQQLKSGLTTTFAVVATNGDGVRTGAQVEIRYDLWDEKYLVRKIELDGSSTRTAFASLEELERWWRSTPVRLLKVGASSRRVNVELRVLPFSAAESRDAREWLAKSGGVTQQPAAAHRSTESGQIRLPSSGVIDALIGTSLDAKPLISFRWRTELVVQGAR